MREHPCECHESDAAHEEQFRLDAAYWRAYFGLDGLEGAAYRRQLARFAPSRLGTRDEMIRRADEEEP